MSIYKTFENEILSFITGSIEKSPGVYFSQYETVKKISRFANRTFETGNKDSLGNDKYWFEIAQPRIESERKNIDFDTKDVEYYSAISDDSEGVYFLNLANQQFNRETKQGVKINNAIERSSGWGNVVWKKIKNGYELVDMLNFYVINQAAETLEHTPAIERHMLTQSQLRQKKGVWDNDVIDDVIENCKNTTFQTTKDGGISQEFEIPYYEIYERNGEISLYELKEAQGKKPTEKDRDTFVLAKIVLAGLTNKPNEKGSNKKYALYADTISKSPYKEAHRGEYKGSWWREGMYEILFDIQVRANEIGNQIARGLRTRNVYRASDVTIAENIITDLLDGDIVKSKDLQQVETRMNNLDQLIADWNRLMELADKLCNSYEIVNGESTSGQPFRLGALLNTNANKLFDFLREKISLPVQEIWEEWIMPMMIQGLKLKDVIKVTGDSKYYDEVCQYAANAKVLEKLKEYALNDSTPTPEHVEELTRVVCEEYKKKPEMFVDDVKAALKDIQPRVSVIISGENINKQSELQSLATFIQLETDPVKRSAMLDEARKKQGIRIPRTTTPPEQMQQPKATTANQPMSIPTGEGQLQEQQI